jgi:Cu/Ag efflux pump CusA
MRIPMNPKDNVDVNREEAARYGLTIAHVHTAVSSGIGGQNIAKNIEGRERYPINVRYQRDFRDNVEQMRGVLIGTPSGAQIPLGQVARISLHARSCHDSEPRRHADGIHLHRSQEH